MKVWAVTLPFALLLAGCATRSYEFKPERSEAYIDRHPGLPAERAEALRKGQVVSGMTREEVKLCLGNPQETRRMERDGQAVFVWDYQRPVRQRGELERSGMWQQPIPLARVYFDAAGAVRSCRQFSPGQGEDDMEIESTPAAPLESARPAPSPAAVPAAASAPVPDATNPGGGFEGWPSLELNGVVLGAGEPYAIVNRAEVSVGDTVAGVKILRITARGVTLQRGDAVRFLSPGRATQP